MNIFHKHQDYMNPHEIFANYIRQRKGLMIIAKDLHELPNEECDEILNYIDLELERQQNKYNDLCKLLKEWRDTP